MVAMLAATTVGAAPGSDRVELKLKFREGRQQFVEMTLKLRQKLNMQGQIMDQHIDTTTVVEEAVEGVKDGIATVRMTFDRMAMSTKVPAMPGASMSFDSDAPDENPGAARMLRPIFGEMIGKSLLMKIGPDGTVHELTGMQAIHDRITKEAAANPIWMNMREQFTDAAARVEYGESRFDFLPDKPVAVGDTWSRETKRDTAALGPTISKATYKLADITDYDHDGKSHRVAVIEYQGTMKTDEAAPQKAKPGGIRKIKSSEFQGTVRFAIDQGRVLTNEHTGTMDAVAAGPMGDIEFNMTSDQRLVALTRKARAAQKAKATEKKKESTDDEGA